MFIVPGTLVEILGQGVLIQGESGMGKSTLALGLIDRGHQLIADDAVCLEKDQQQKITGFCPPEIQNFMSIKEFGIINVAEMFGETSLKVKTELKFVISLSLTLEKKRECLSESYETTSILDVDIPMLTISSVYPSLAILVETTIRNFALQCRGYHAAKALIEQQQKFFQTNPIKSS